MAHRICTVDDCGRKDNGGGLCTTHQYRLKKFGNVQAHIPIASRKPTRKSKFPRRPPGLSPAEVFVYYMGPTPPEPNQCWLWTAYSLQSGYGAFRYGDTIVTAHRTSFELFSGQIPEGMHVRHACDTPACVQPAHLLIGTHADNMRDMAERGRAVNDPALGSRHYNAVLTEDDVKEIRKLRENRAVKLEVLADRYGVGPSQISAIAHRRTWKHI